ncbi:MAG: sulfite exporter TauE/SafE family protein [Acidobacteriota bacterium]
MEFWYLFPVGLTIASVGMSSGVSGSNFWIPIYLLGMGLDPRVAFWASLLTLLFGFGSGVLRNLRAGTVSGPLLARSLAAAGPMACLGAVASNHLPVDGLLTAFAAFAGAYGIALLLPASGGGDSPQQRRWFPRVVALTAGALQGAIATGAGALLMPSLLKDEKISHHAEAIGTTVTAVFTLSLISVVFRIDAALWVALQDHGDALLEMMTFAVPGVVIGGQVGPRIAQRLPRRWLRRYVGALLVVVGCLVALRLIGGGS